MNAKDELFSDASDPPALSTAQLRNRFKATWKDADTADAVWMVLERSYSEDHRRYHTLRHISECLGVAERYASYVGWSQIPVELELAIWFHDLVYQPGARANERKSASLFKELASSAGFDVEVVRVVRALILDTKTHSGRDGVLAEAMCDCDLWVLGSSPERYMEYADQVRQEHERFQAWQYQAGRARFLRMMLRRKRVFVNPSFESSLGQRARSNMRDELDSLEERAGFTTRLTRKLGPGLRDYHVLSLESANPSVEDEARFFLAAHRHARALALERYGDPDCYALVFNGGRVRRRNWPHFHIVLARTRTERRVRLLLLYLKQPLSRCAAVLDRSRNALTPRPIGLRPPVR